MRPPLCIRFVSISQRISARHFVADIGPCSPRIIAVRRERNHSSHLCVHTPTFKPLSSNLLSVGHQDSSDGAPIELS